jgi:hypothetical protein
MTRTLFITAIVLILEVLIVGVIAPSNWLHGAIMNERQMVENWMGNEATINLVENTNSIYSKLFVATGLVHKSYGLIPTEEERKNSGGFDDLGRETFHPFAKERIDIMWSAIYQSIQRTALLFMWLPYALALFIPALIDGISTRSIKKVTYGYASPVRYHTAFHSIVILFAAIPFYLALPIAVSPLMIPLWAAAISASVMIMSSNLQKQI